MKKISKRDKNKRTKSAYVRGAVNVDWQRVEELEQQRLALLKRFRGGAQ